MKKTICTPSQSVHVNFDKGWVYNIWLSSEHFDTIEKLLYHFKETRSITDAVNICDILLKSIEEDN